MRWLICHLRHNGCETTVSTTERPNGVIERRSTHSCLECGRSLKGPQR